MRKENPAPPFLEQDLVSLSSASGTVCAVLFGMWFARVNFASNGSHGHTHTHAPVYIWPGVYAHTYHTHTHVPVYVWPGVDIHTSTYIHIWTITHTHKLVAL